MSCSSRAATRRSEGARPVLPRSARRRRRGQPLVPAPTSACAATASRASGSSTSLRGARSTATGWFSRPGFIDMHTHSDVQLLAHPDHACKVHQGVTLEVLGQDGLALAPTDDATMALLRAQLAGWNGAEPELDDSWRSVAEYLARFDRTTAVNVCYLLPHATLRLLTVGADDRARHGGRARRDARARASGSRRGRGRPVGRPHLRAGHVRDDDELVELCRELRGGAYYCPHHRNYGLHAIKGYADSIEIARRAGVPLHLAHAHLGFACNRGRAPELLALIDGARNDGVDITLDTYPYLAGATYLHALLPGWVHAGGPEAIDRAAARPRPARAPARRARGAGFRRLPRRAGRVGHGGARRRDDRRPRGARGQAADRRLLRALRRLGSLGVGTRALRQRGERARDDAAPRAHRGQRRHPRRRAARIRAAGGHSRATSPSTCASSACSACRSACAT